MKKLFKPGSLDPLQDRLAYHFQDESLLHQALIHRSYINESRLKSWDSNERLEFLGDAVLELVVSDCLYRAFSKRPEGDLTRIRSDLVCEGSFARLAKDLDLPAYLVMGKGEDQSGGREKASIQADAFEALCGAIYLDGGYDYIYDFFSNHLKEILDRDREDKSLTNYKTELQELMFKKKKDFDYIRMGQEGPDHDRIFYVSFQIEGRDFSQGVGKSVREAEQDAARKALVKLGHSH